MAKRKVLIVVHQLNYGGVQVSLISALDAIDYDENEVTVYIRKNRIDLIDKINKNVSKVIVNEDNTRYYRKPYTAFLTVVSAIKKFFKKNTEETEQKIVDYIVKKQFEYEHMHYFRDHEAFDVAISYIQGYTAEFVAEYIKADRKIAFWQTSTDDYHDLHSRIFKDYESIVAVSQGAVITALGFYPQYADKMTLIKPYTDAQNVKLKSKAVPVSVPFNKLILCTCGRIAKPKGFDLAVNTAKSLKENGLDFVWYFVGDGAERKNIENMIAEGGLQNNIVITGMQSNPYPYMNSCDIYVQPSYEESFGITIKEAKILCKPVVSTKTVGACEQITNMVDGVLTDISAEAIADGIILLAKDNALKEKIITTLEKIDYYLEFDDFKQEWKKLLEG